MKELQVCIEALMYVINSTVVSVDSKVWALQSVIRACETAIKELKGEA